MTWLAQVVHVMAKDAREARWPLVAYLATLSIATAHALRWLESPKNILDASMIGVVGVAMFVVASLVQADSPTRADAYWATKPFHASAVFAAKVLQPLLVIAIPALFAQAIALYSLGIDPADVTRQVSLSAYAFGLWLLVSLVLGAMTRDIRSFIVAIVAVPTLLALGVALLPEFPSFTSGTRGLVGVATTVISLTLVAALYAYRDNRRHTWIVAIGAVAGAGLAMFGGSSWPDADREASASAAPRHSTLRVEVADLQLRANPSVVTLTVRIEDAARDERITFVPTSVSFRTRSGQTVQLEVRNVSAVLAAPELPGARGITWPSRTNAAANGFSFAVTLSPSDVVRMAGGVDRVNVEGFVTVALPRLVGTLPITSGASVKADGIRIEVERTFGGEPTPTAVNVRETAVPRDGQAAPSTVYRGDGALELVLVNAARGQARTMFKQAGVSNGGSLVLPGTDVHDESSLFTLERSRESITELRTDGIMFERDLTPDAANTPVDSIWSQHPRIVAIRWIPRRGYRIHGAVAITAQ